MRDSSPSLAPESLAAIILGFSSPASPNQPEFLFLHSSDSPVLFDMTVKFFERKFDCSIETPQHLNSDALWNLARRWSEERPDFPPQQEQDFTAVFSPVSAAHITGVDSVVVGVPVSALREKIAEKQQVPEKNNAEEELYSRSDKRRRENPKDDQEQQQQQDNNEDDEAGDKQEEEDEDDEMKPGRELKEALSEFARMALGLRIEKMDLKEVRTGPASLSDDGYVVFSSLEDVIPVLESITEEILFPFASHSFL